MHDLEKIGLWLNYDDVQRLKMSADTLGRWIIRDADTMGHIYRPKLSADTLGRSDAFRIYVSCVANSANLPKDAAICLRNRNFCLQKRFALGFDFLYHSLAISVRPHTQCHALHKISLKMRIRIIRF